MPKVCCCWSWLLFPLEHPSSTFLVIDPVISYPSFKDHFSAMVFTKSFGILPIWCDFYVLVTSPLWYFAFLRDIFHSAYDIVISSVQTPCLIQMFNLFTIWAGRLARDRESVLWNWMSCYNTSFLLEHIVYKFSVLWSSGENKDLSRS